MAPDSAPVHNYELDLTRTMAASVTQHIAFGERAGQKVQRIGLGFGYEGEQPALTGTPCASVNGFSLHANTQVPAHPRDQLERLIRYTVRGAVTLERLEEAVNGDFVYMFTEPWSRYDTHWGRRSVHNDATKGRCLLVLQGAGSPRSVESRTRGLNNSWPASRSTRWPCSYRVSSCAFPGLDASFLDMQGTPSAR
jgi:hypothetical protein